MSNVSIESARSARALQMTQLELESPMCDCPEPHTQRAAARTSFTFRNPGRRFFGCRNYRRQGEGAGPRNCGFFEWYDLAVALPRHLVLLILALKAENITNRRVASATALKNDLLRRETLAGGKIKCSYKCFVLVILVVFVLGFLVGHYV